MDQSIYQDVASPDNAAFLAYEESAWSSSELALFQENFLPWWHCANECLLATLHQFRRFDDDDITALYLAIWQKTLKAAHEASNSSLEYSVSNLVSLVSAAVGAGASASLVELSDATGIPRETARRKLDESAAFRVIARSDDGTFRLASVSADIVPLFENCTALAMQVLDVLRRPVEGKPAHLSLASWTNLMEAYLSVILAWWAMRRSTTRGSAVVSVQCTIEVLTILKMHRRLAASGRASRLDLRTALSLTVECWATPYLLSQIASISRLNVEHVRRMCRSLAAQGRIRFSGAEVVHPIRPIVPFPEKLGTGLLPRSLQSAARQLSTGAEAVFGLSL